MAGASPAMTNSGEGTERAPPSAAAHGTSTAAAACTQVRERFIRLCERIASRLGDDAGLRHDGEEFPRVVTGEIGDGDDLALHEKPHDACASALSRLSQCATRRQAPSMVRAPRKRLRCPHGSVTISIADCP